MKGLARMSFNGKRPGSAGFTLIEIMMVMVLIVIVLGVSTIFFANRLPSENLNTAGREMSAMLRFARLLAKNSGEERSVFINLDTGKYGISGVQTRTVPRDISVKIIDPLKGEVLRGEHSITFSDTGSVTSERIALTGGKRSLYIDLDPVLGAVVVR